MDSSRFFVISWNYMLCICGSNAVAIRFLCFRPDYSVGWLEALVNWRGEVSTAEDQLESVRGSQRSCCKQNDALIVSSLKGLWHQLQQILKRAWTQHNFWSAGRNVSTTSHQGRGGFHREGIVAFIISFALINCIEHMLPFLSLPPRVLLSTSKAVHCGTFVSSTLSC